MCVLYFVYGARVHVFVFVSSRVRIKLVRIQSHNFQENWKQYVTIIKSAQTEYATTAQYAWQKYDVFCCFFFLKQETNALKFNTHSYVESNLYTYRYTHTHSDNNANWTIALSRRRKTRNIKKNHSLIVLCLCFSVRSYNDGKIHMWSVAKSNKHWALSTPRHHLNKQI